MNELKYKGAYITLRMIKGKRVADIRLDKKFFRKFYSTNNKNYDQDIIKDAKDKINEEVKKV